MILSSVLQVRYIKMLKFFDNLSMNMQDGEQTDVFLMDFAKAFDKVCHTLLVHKLHHYRICGKITRWTEN